MASLDWIRRKSAPVFNVVLSEQAESVKIKPGPPRPLKRQRTTSSGETKADIKRTTTSVATLLARLTAPTYPLVVVQYKVKDLGAGHEERLHWTLVVLTDRSALTGLGWTATSRARSGWHARHASLTLHGDARCLGGVQVGTVRAADVFKVREYLRAAPTPAHSSRAYVLELLELLRPFRVLRRDLQGGKPEVADLLEDMREASRKTGKVNRGAGAAREWRPYIKMRAI